MIIFLIKGGMFVRKTVVFLCTFMLALASFTSFRASATDDLCFAGINGECVFPNPNPSPTKYTITFDSNGGSPVSPITESAGTPITEPIPSRSGYYFGGWYRDRYLTQKFTFNTMPSYDLILYAKWIEDKGGSSFDNSYIYNPFTDGLVDLSLEVNGDVDYIKVYLNDDTEYFIASKGSIDLQGTLYNPSRSIIGSYDSDNENYENPDNFKFTFKPEVSGYYYLEIKGGSNSVTGNYSIIIIDINDISYDYEMNLFDVYKEVVWTSTHYNPNLHEPEMKSLTLSWVVYTEASVSIEAELDAIFAKTTVSSVAKLGYSFTQEESVTFVIEAGLTKRLEFGYHFVVTEGILNYYDMNGNLIYSKAVSAEWSYESYSKSEII